jgi:hypothetical protein
MDSEGSALGLIAVLYHHLSGGTEESPISKDRPVVPKLCAAKYFWGAVKYSNIFTEMTLSKYRAKINVEEEMRVAVSSLIPRFEKMCSKQQAHPSH